MGEGAGMRIGSIKRINLIPELTRAWCTIVGLWGPATQSGSLLQMRALDWDAEAPMSQYPVVGIYNFTDGKSHPFANFAWGGIIGSLAGMSSNIGVSE